MAVKGLEVDPMVFAKHEVTAEMPIHPQDQDLGIHAQDITLAFVSFFSYIF